MKIFLALIGFFCLSHAGPAFAEPDIREGLWEITIRMEIAGRPGDAFPPATRTLCLTDKNKIPELLQQDQSCQITDTELQGNAASWKMKCRSRESLITGGGRITYRGERFDGIIHIHMQQAEAAPVKLIQRVTGRRGGECP